METNPNVDPDAPLPHDEVSPQATSTENPPPEPAAASAPEIAAEAAAAEALPEPLVEVAAEQPLEPSQPEAPPLDEPESSQETEISDSSTVLSETAEAAAVVPEPEVTESQVEPQTETESKSQPEPVTDGPEAGGTFPESEAAGFSKEEGETPQEVSERAEEGVTAPGEGSQEAPDLLATLADQSQTSRLSPADEERATTLLKEALLDGRAGVIRAIDALPKLPWIIGVNAVTAVWPELKPVFRSQMLAGLVRTEGDAAKRMRLSLARGLFKQDVPISLKIVVGASKEMRDRETGAMHPKHSQIFANVLIGRAKPWIAQLPLAELKPNDADIVVNCALLSAFSLPHAPITQLGIVKWAAEAGRLGKLHQTVIDAAQKSLSRWSGKWQNALRKEVPDLPESFAAALKAVAPKEASQPRAEGASQEPQESVPTESEERTEPLEETAAENVTAPEPDSESEAAEVSGERGITPDEEADAEAAEAPRPEISSEQGQEGVEQGKPKPRPVYESKTVPRKAQQGQPQQPQQGQATPQQSGKGGPALKEASVPELLRQVEAQFQSLRTELNSTQNKLRQRDEDLRRAQKKAAERSSAPIIEGEPTPEELARLNRQLESRNQELQARIEELLADSEARAVSVGAVSGEPVNDPNVQLRTLLGLKLQEDFEDFLALEKESPDIVVQQHYRTVLRHVFEVLTREGVQFEAGRPEEAHG